MRASKLKEFVERCKIEDYEIERWDEEELSCSIYLGNDLTRELEYNIVLKTGEIIVRFYDWKALSFENMREGRIGHEISLEESFEMRSQE